ncbi:MAG: DUF1549 and DUF1553 domain-containing protein [Planctomycetota bacterium]|nr:DUF1549 and DUF1553 domain-containing protein [Planctomycetota bacterium]
MRLLMPITFLLFSFSCAMAVASGETPWALTGWNQSAPPILNGNSSSVRNFIDQFVLARLKQESLTPSPEATPETLLARLYHSLTGLAPTADQREAYLADKNPRRYEAALERLLADPAYGERWARHWLDIARYADSKGYAFLEDRHLHFAWTYRDWVIDALNRDMPYDQFVREQIAADRLHPKGSGGRENLAALGFLTVGRRFLNNQHDILDDRIDVITRGLLGLTVACARCHDHKNDPVSMEDYYSLYAVLAGSREPDDLPRLRSEPLSKAEKDFQTEQQRRDDAVDHFVSLRRAEVLSRLAQPSVIAPHLLAASADAATQTVLSGEYDLNPAVVSKWRDHIAAQSDADPLWGPWKALAVLPAEGWQKAANLLAGNSVRQPEWSRALLQPVPVDRMDLARRVAEVLERSRRGEPALAEYKLQLTGPKSPLNIPLEQTGKLLGRVDRDHQRDLQRQADEWRAVTPPSLARAMVLEELPDPPIARVFKRGNPLRPGPEIPRQFVDCLVTGAPVALEKGSGRLDLAHALTRPDHPLLARVIVNRVWMHHFGEGLIRTPGDLGNRGETPTHPALLDWLARDFISHGWSLKHLHRTILTSATYRQSSTRRPELEERDPDNRLLARQNVRRIDWETLRDRLLQSAGRLDNRRGGPPEPVLAWPHSNRRTIYTYVERQNAPGAPRAFDVASPDTSTPRRHETLTAAQGLFLLNSPFVIEQAVELAKRAESDNEPVNALFRMAWGRAATERERAEGVVFLKGSTQANSGTPSLWSCGQATLRDGAVTEFVPLSHFTGSAWQATALLPAPKTGKMHLTASGGHPASDASMVVVRRFTSPADMTVSVSGVLEHPDYRGDGVSASVVGPDGRVIVSWSAKQRAIATIAGPIRLLKGQSLDCVVAPGKDPGYDTFLWSPVLIDQATGKPYDSAREFDGAPVPAITPMAQLAQALLLGHPFHFVE